MRLSNYLLPRLLRVRVPGTKGLWVQVKDDAPFMLLVGWHSAMMSLTEMVQDRSPQGQVWAPAPHTLGSGGVNWLISGLNPTLTSPAVQGLP